MSGQSRLRRGSDAAGRWESATEAGAGALVDVRVTYRNTGDVQHNNVVLKIQLPPTLRYRTGTTVIATSNNRVGRTVSDSIATGRGLNIGSYTAGRGAYVRFTVRVGGKLSCGSEQQHIIATANAHERSRKVSIPMMSSKIADAQRTRWPPRARVLGRAGERVRWEPRCCSPWPRLAGIAPVRSFELVSVVARSGWC